MAWSGGLMEWKENNNIYISVVFSWKLQEAWQRAAWHKASGMNVIIGGPAIHRCPHFFDDVAQYEINYNDAISRHNPQATFTSRGCIRNCSFCIVPKSEGKLVELDDWPIRPIVCDNNFLACSRTHFDNVIDKLKPLKGIDFNQGLDARLLTKHHAERLAEINTKAIRLSWDHTGIEARFRRAYELLINAGIAPYHITVFCLIGFNDDPEDALYRLQTVKDLGAVPFAMRYQPLDAQKRNSFIGDNWNERDLRHFTRYWNRQLRGLKGIPFKEYKYAGYQWSKTLIS